MKTLVLFFLSPLIVLTQTIQIVSYSQQTIGIGDNFCVKFYNPNNEAFYFNIETQSTSFPNLLTWWDVYTNPNSPDTITACFVIPPNLPCGPALIGTNLLSWIPITIECKAITTVGIQEYRQREIIPIYYDLQGNIINMRKNELIIQQIGNTRKKIAITDQL